MSTHIGLKLGNDRLAPFKFDERRGCRKPLFKRQLHAFFHNIQNLTGYRGQVQLAGLRDGQPVQIQQFARRTARVFGVGVNMGVIHHEKAGIEAARAICRRHSAGNEIHMRQRRHDMLERAL